MCCGVLCCAVLCRRRAWRVSRGCIDIDLPEAKLEVYMDQLDSATPNIKCTKLSQVRLALHCIAVVSVAATHSVVSKPLTCTSETTCASMLGTPRHQVMLSSFPLAPAASPCCSSPLCCCPHPYLLQWESAARMLVAEMMILAGQAVGQVGAAASLPLPYRGQEEPRLPSEAFINALPDGPCKGFALRKCMTRSVVEPTLVRHASLALDAYVQVTSPIRRYTDIIAHFNIKVCGCGCWCGCGCACVLVCMSLSCVVCSVCACMTINQHSD